MKKVNGMSNNVLFLSACAFLSFLPRMSYADDLPTFQSYQVTGKDFTTLNDSIIANRPNGFNSANEWNISWQFNFDERKDGCYLSKPSVSKKITITLPNWDDQSNGNKAIQLEWQRYVAALRAHQLGHVAHAAQAQAAILAVFENFPAQSNCESLKKKANAAARKVLNDYYEKDKQYEKRTEKGLTQGAVFKEPDESI